MMASDPKSYLVDETTFGKGLYILAAAAKLSAASLRPWS